MPISRYGAFVSIAAIGCGVDLAVKSWMFAWLGMPVRDNVCWVWTGVFGFQTSLNEGALFGMGQGFSLVFAALSLLAIVGIVYWLFWAGAAVQWPLTLALALITAGVLGNLYDRLGLPGLIWPQGYEQAGQPVYAVRDYILVMIGQYHWPNFNIADSLLVCGAAALVLFSGLHRDEGRGTRS